MDARAHCDGCKIKGGGLALRELKIKNMDNKLIFGDSYKEIDKIKENSIDLIVQDPPYGSTNFDWDRELDYKSFFPKWWRILKENGVIIITSQQPYATDVINASRKYFRYEIIWEKTIKMGFVNANKMPLRSHENILVFYKKLPNYNPQKYKVSEKHRLRKQRADRYDGYSKTNKKCKIQYYENTGDRYPSSVILCQNHNGNFFGKKNNSTFHGTQKPVDLFRWLIRTYSNEGDVVFDGFSGSGTTGIACLIENRNYILIESDKKIYTKSLARLQKKHLEIQNSPMLF